MIWEFIDFIKYVNDQHISFIKDEIQDGKKDFMTNIGVHKNFEEMFITIHEFANENNIDIKEITDKYIRLTHDAVKDMELKACEKCPAGCGLGITDNEDCKRLKDR